MAQSGFLAKLLTAMSGAFPRAFKDASAGNQAAYALDLAIGVVSPPIGSIVAWTTHIAGTPTLPTGWKLCDGTAVVDAQSPMNGRNVPNLNGAAGTGHFLRGSDVSGTIQPDQVVNHVHDLGSHTHGPGTLAVQFATGAAGSVTLATRTTLQTAGLQTIVNGVTAAATGNTLGPSTTNGTETRPLNMSVKWIIRIK